MAQSFATDSGTLIIPDVYSKITVQTSNSGLATNGVLVLMGEADGGNDFSLEADLQSNSFGPDQYGAVQAKYLSGPIVDAFRTAAEPSNDPQIPGSPNRIIVVKTNASAKASGSLLNPDSSTYAKVSALSGGALGNLVYVNVAQTQAEVLPTTGAFTWVHPAGTANLGLSVNGVVGSVAVAANTTPAAFVTAVNAASLGVTAAGGAVKAYVTASGTLAVGSVAGTTITITRSVNWSVTPAVGDTLEISSTSVIKGGSNQNVGSYLVTASNATTVTCVKKSDGAPGATATPGTITAPVAVSAVNVVSTTADLQGYGVVTVANNSATIVQGAGKSLEFAEATTGTDLISRYVWIGTAAASFISKLNAPQLLVSGAEQRVQTNVNRSVDNVQESWAAGGEIGMTVSYVGTSGTIAITSTGFSTTVAGGSGASISAYNFVQVGKTATIADVVSFINAQPGYSASVGNTAIGQMPATALDEGTFNIASVFGAKNGRVKDDAYRYAQAVLNNSTTVAVPQAPAGLPAVMAVTYLAGGTRGGTTDATIVAALAALESVQCNFIIPLISRDATLDIANGQTDPSSTYTIAAVNANVRTHVLAMSVLKRKRNRQAFLSIKDTFANAKAAAANISSFRCSMNFQDIKTTGQSGSIVQFQPWMGAVAAAGMQAAGFYRPIVNKFINISGALQAAGDFNDLNPTNMEDALLAGLLPVMRGENGGFRWVSDQTTYGKDNNFSLNSIQATYITDVVALSSAQQMRNAFVGQALSDVSPGILLSYFEGLMADFVRLKLLSPSDDAPGGFKNASVSITGPVFVVNAEIKIAGALYFGLLNFLVSQVTASASQGSSNG